MTGIYLGNQAVYDPLVLPNNSRINGVEHFYQTTKPTTRGDGSALVAGDRWWKIDEGTEWFWNGTYWLSTPKYVGVGTSNAVNNSYQTFSDNNYIMPRFLQVYYKTFLGRMCFVTRSHSTLDINNYWEIILFCWPSPNTTWGFTLDNAPGNRWTGSRNINTVVDTAFTFFCTEYFKLGFNKIGNPAPIYQFGFSLEYFFIYE